jgi:predicted transposase/invertase (TIGR01784 family)
MGETDNPLKLLIAEFSEAFAVWLLGVPVQVVRPLNVEFPGAPARGDLLFEVIDAAGRIVYLHIELQGRRSHEPMPLRMLDYLSRIVQREIGSPDDKSPLVESVVIYVGDGAGKGDDGAYRVMGLDGATLAWRYRAIRLWEMEADSLFALNNPAFLALVGQTRLTNPQTTLPQALSAIRATTPEEKERLLTALVSLLRTEEVIEMVEKMLEASETLLLDTPYLRRMREMGWREGRQEGVQIGREEGVQIGRQEGVQIGREDGLREAILEAVVRKFNPSAADYRALQHQLEAVHGADALQQILLELFDIDDATDILTLVASA